MHCDHLDTLNLAAIVIRIVHFQRFVYHKSQLDILDAIALGDTAAGIGVAGTSDSEDGVVGKSAGDVKSGVWGLNTAGGIGVAGKGTSGYGGWFSSDNEQNDLVVGGPVGQINSDPLNASSDLILASNNDVVVQLDKDAGGEGLFKIRNTLGFDVATVDESGMLTATLAPETISNSIQLSWFSHRVREGASQLDLGVFNFCALTGFFFQPQGDLDFDVGVGICELHREPSGLWWLHAQTDESIQCKVTCF